MIEYKSMLSNSMIMQRDVPFPVWSEKKAVVAFLNKKYTAQYIDAEKKWLTVLDPVKAGGPFTMEIISDEGSVFINDILSGDVWLCSGQSNMEMMMQRLRDDFSEEWETIDNSLEERGIDYSQIRHFKVPQIWDFSGPHSELSDEKWIKASSESIDEFSGVAWFFAKKMYEKHRVPVGLVNTAWGGTPVESWMSREALKDFPEKISLARKYADSSLCEEIAAKNISEIRRWEERVNNEDIGIKEEWHQMRTDICGWGDITLPGYFAEAGLSGFNGVIWLAKEFDADTVFPFYDTVASDSCLIWLGTIIDADKVFINGTETGNTDYRYPPRKYKIPAGLIKRGKNRIVIRVICNNGEGGITPGKPFKIFSDNACAELSGIWKYKTGASLPCARPDEFFFQRQPTGPYNAMIAPVLKFPLKGVIWYQGESNETNPGEYAALFRSMIEDWRMKYREHRAKINEQIKENKEKTEEGSELPFLFVQLPIWRAAAANDENAPWALIRETQMFSLSLPATGMAAALDLGEWNDLHPINKKDIGYRLFLAAEKLLNGIDNSSPGPVLNKVKNEKLEMINGKIFLYFDNYGDGLTAEPQEEISGNIFVTVIGEEGHFRLPAKIESHDKISIDISSVKNPRKILYAWADNPRDRQLFNSGGLPAIPFRIKLI